MAVILETGINNVQKMIDLEESLDIAKSNPIKSIGKNQQYQHNGGGTALLIERNFQYQDPRIMFNDEKKSHKS